jgi:hypothetical protein
VAYNIQTGRNNVKLLTEYESVTEKGLFDNAVLAVLMYGRKYDVIPQNSYCSRESNVRILVFHNSVPYERQCRYRTEYGKRSILDNAIRCWLKQFQEADSVRHRKGTGRTSTPQEVVDRIEEVWTSYVPRKARILNLFSILLHSFYKQ